MGWRSSRSRMARWNSSTGRGQLPKEPWFRNVTLGSSGQRSGGHPGLRRDARFGSEVMEVGFKIIGPAPSLPNSGAGSKPKKGSTDNEGTSHGPVVQTACGRDRWGASLRARRVGENPLGKPVAFNLPTARAERCALPAANWATGPQNVPSQLLQAG